MPKERHYLIQKTRAFLNPKLMEGCIVDIPARSHYCGSEALTLAAVDYREGCLRVFERHGQREAGEEALLNLGGHIECAAPGGIGENGIAMKNVLRTGRLAAPDCTGHGDRIKMTGAVKPKHLKNAWVSQLLTFVAFRRFLSLSPQKGP